jgi:hypothetical protein
MRTPVNTIAIVSQVARELFWSGIFRILGQTRSRPLPYENYATSEVLARAFRRTVPGPR